MQNTENLTCLFYRKFAVSESLPQITGEVMDEAIDLMTKEKQPINPVEYIDFMIYNALAVTALRTEVGSDRG